MGFARELFPFFRDTFFLTLLLGCFAFLGLDFSVLRGFFAAADSEATGGGKPGKVGFGGIPGYAYG